MMREKIKATGRRYSVGGKRGDFDIANAEANFPETPNGYVWHHMDDFNPKTGEISLQLIKKQVIKRLYLIQVLQSSGKIIMEKNMKIDYEKTDS